MYILSFQFYFIYLIFYKYLYFITLLFLILEMLILQLKRLFDLFVHAGGLGSAGNRVIATQSQRLK